MIRVYYGLFCLLFLLSSCAVSPPALPHLDQETPEPGGCPTLFPQGNYQYVHLIEFSMPGGQHGTAMGVTVIKDGTIHSSLMTVEGFVLFSAVFSDSLIINRAVPPFNRPGFAEGMMEDIKAIFLRPQGVGSRGALGNGQSVCRLENSNNQIVDILDTNEQCRQVLVYTPDLHLQTTITGFACTVFPDGSFIPKRLILRSENQCGYELQLVLVSAEKRE